MSIVSGVTSFDVERPLRLLVAACGDLIQLYGNWFSDSKKALFKV